MLTHFIKRAVGDSVYARVATTPAGSPDRVAPVHLDAAIGWLLRSIEVCDGKASSKGYRFMKGWMPPYPETTGYIIPTLLSLARERRSPGLAATAEAMGTWLAGIQRPDGGFAGREYGIQSEPDVFDTGMILLGFNTLVHKGLEETFAAPARRAAEFLVSSMDESGCFTRNMSHQILHAYNVRSAWALMAAGQLLGEPRFIDRAADCARWTMAQQNENGFYLSNNFKPGGNANTHGTAYVMRGLLQIHYLSGDEVCLESVRRAADEVCRLTERHGRIAAELGPEWQYLSTHVCLTGYAQLAIVLYRLFAIGGEARYRATADRLLSEVARYQALEEGKPWHGAISGSFPIYGRYAPLQYPNWATKFFIDAILAQSHVHSGKSTWPDQDLYGG